MFLLVALSVAGVAQDRTWDHGAGSQEWDNLTNWDPDGVPTSGDTVLIPNGFAAGEYPDLSASAVNADVLDLTIESAASLTLGGLSLTIAGDLANSGTLDGGGGGAISIAGDVTAAGNLTSTGTVTLNGGLQSVDFTGASLNNVTVAPGSDTNLAADMTVGGVLTVAGTLTTGTN